MLTLSEYLKFKEKLTAWQRADDNAPVFVTVRESGKTLRLLKTIPASRSECRNGPRPCGAVRCIWHAWLRPGEERAGRRYEGRPPPTTLEPRWLEVPTPPSCELDMIERGEVSASAMGKAKGKTARRIEQEIKRALGKLKAQGVTVEELKP